MLMPKGPVEQLGTSQIVPVRGVHSRAVTTTLGGRHSLVPHPSCGTCTVEQALRPRLTSSASKPCRRQRWVFDPLKKYSKKTLKHLYSYIDITKYMCVFLQSINKSHAVFCGCYVSCRSSSLIEGRDTSTRVVVPLHNLLEGGGSIYQLRTGV